MHSNKPRLYVALYVRSGAVKMPGGEDKYHWAFITGPKTESPESRGKRIEAHDPVDTSLLEPRPVWRYEESDVEMRPAGMILARILIAKVQDEQRFLEVVRGVPMRPGQPGWNCIGWLKEALEALKEDGTALGRSVCDWGTVRDAAMEYVAQKRAQHRFDGQAKDGEFDTSKVSTYNLLDRAEIYA